MDKEFVTKVVNGLGKAMIGDLEATDFFQVVYNRLIDAKINNAIICPPYIVMEHKNDNNYLIFDIREGFGGFGKVDVEFNCDHKPTLMDIELAIHKEYGKAKDKAETLYNALF